MKLSRTRLAAILADRIDREDLSQATLAKELAAYLLAEGRGGELDSLLRDIMQDRADRGVVEVIASSAFPLSGTVRADIEAQIKAVFPAARTIILSEVHDQSVVAGVRLELANQQLDLSIRSKLNRFKQLTTAGATT
jgi:F0F1-type ATP synthase delta subunit